MPWFQLIPSELDYAQSAPFCFDHQLLLEASPQTVFEVLRDSDWAEWFVDFRKVEWTSPDPYQTGSTRTVTLKTLAVKERFLAWEPGQRFSFSIDAISLPLLKQMMEDMQLEPVEKGRCTRVRWRVYYTPSLLMSSVHPLARRIFGSMFKQSLTRLKDYAEKKAAPGASKGRF